MQKRNRQALVKGPEEEDPHVRASKLMDDLILEAEQQEKEFYEEVSVSTMLVYASIKQSEDLVKNLLIWLVVEKLVALKGAEKWKPEFENKKRKIRTTKRDRAIEGVCLSLQKLLLKDKWRMTERDYYRLVQHYINHFKIAGWNEITPVNELIEKGKHILKNRPPSSLMRQALETLRTPEEVFLGPSYVKRNQKISTLLGRGEELPVDPQDDLGRYLTGFYQSLPVSDKRHWKNFWALCLKEGNKKIPGAKWLSEVSKVLNEIPEEQLQQPLLEALPVCIKRLQDIHANPDFFLLYLNKTNLCILKAMFWSCTPISNMFYLQTLETYIILALKKKPGVGPISLASATAGLWVLSRLPQEGKSIIISRIRVNFRDPVLLKLIDKGMTGFGAE